MKYMMYSTLMLLICVGASAFTVRLMGHRRQINRPVKIAAAAVLSLVYAAAAGLVYLEVYYHADAAAEACLAGSDRVTVSRTENGYLFDGPGDDKAIIFYPGAKVEGAAYAPLMLAVAESGADAFLVEMPFRFAFFGIDSAGTLMESHEYDSWYLMGHSMGGLAACSYASEHVSEIDGIIYLASYPSAGPFEGMKMLSVYGTEDGCLSRDEYEKSRGYWPDDAEEHVIQGGNHAQFGGYGSQKGDGEAAVTAEEQQKETVEVVRKWLGQ